MGPDLRGPGIPGHDSASGIYLTFEAGYNLNWFTFDQTRPLAAFNAIEAEGFSAKSGSVRAEPAGEGGQDLGFIATGDFVVYNNVNLGFAATSISARVSGLGNTGRIYVRLDHPTAPPVAVVQGVNTGDWQKYATVTAKVTGATGIHDLYLTFDAGLNLNWFKFGNAFLPDPGKKFRMVFKHSGLCMRPTNGQTGNGIQIEQTPANDRDTSQLFTFSPGSVPGYWFPIDRSGKSLDVFGEEQGAAVGTWDFHSGDNQQFRFDEAPASGYYFLTDLRTAKNGTHFTVDCQGANPATGAKIITWPKKGSGFENQIVKFEEVP